MKQKDIIQIFPSMRKNNRTVRVLKEPKTDSSIRKVYIPSSVAILLAELREEQNETIEALGDMYENYNLVMATSYGLPLGESYLRVKMQEVIDREGLPDVVFHSLRHTSVTYKLKLSGGDIKAVQGDSGHAQADMVTEVYGHILDEDRKKNAQLEGKAAFYDLFIDLKHSTNLRTTAKELDVPERRFVRFLIERRFVYRTASGNVLPYANVKNTGLFCVKDYCNHGHTGSYTLVTPKGKLYFAQLREMILLVS